MFGKGGALDVNESLATSLVYAAEAVHAYEAFAAAPSASVAK
jgi:hypothetical protein